jgi:hypothetical protein
MRRESTWASAAGLKLSSTRRYARTVLDGYQKLSLHERLGVRALRAQIETESRSCSP